MRGEPPFAFPTIRQTRAVVDLDAIAANVRALRSVIGGSHLMAVVKANAYGHGAVAVGRAALGAGAAWLGVYTVEEGLVLRAGGIDAPVLVLGPFLPSEAGAMYDAHLTPTVTTLEAARALQNAANGRSVHYHVKIDTGLTRAGIAPSDAVHFLRRLAEFPALQAEGLFTHFAAADEKLKAPTLTQLHLFQETAHGLEEAGFHFPLRHSANSAAALDLPETHLDMVRTGISLYGYYPSPEVKRDLQLHPALRLESVVSRVQAVPSGTGVGYGHEYRCARETTIALVPIGYGDGLPRQLGRSGQVVIGGTLAPIVGRVSMDQITVDVTDVPGVEVGDSVVLIGDQDGVEQTAEDMALQAGTISYDILTGLLPRVPRIYVRSGEVTSAMCFASGPLPVEWHGQGT